MIALIVIFLGGCMLPVPPSANVKVNANSFIVSGGSYLNSLFNCGTLTNDTGSYSASLNLTQSNINWNTGAPYVSIHINFKGNKTGTFALGPTTTTADTNAVNITYATSGNSSSEFLSQVGTLTITEYGAVGGIIKGTFSGTFYDTDGTPYTITNGQFSEIRGKDTP